MDADTLVKLLLGVVASLSSAIAYMYRQDAAFKGRLIDRLLASQERQVEQQEVQASVSSTAVKELRRVARP